MDEVVRELESTAEVTDDAQRIASVRRLVGAAGPYRAGAILDMVGRPAFEIQAPGQAPVASASTFVSARERLAASLSEGRVAISAPLVQQSPVAEERLRLVALRRGGHVLELLVDMDRLFRGMVGALRGSEAPLRWIVLDDAHRWIAFADGSGSELSTWRAERATPEGDVATLLAQMGHGERGATLLSRDAASSLGLGLRLAVAGFAPVPVRGGEPWSVAIVTSARRVRDRARMAAYRLAAATGLAGLLVALFGVAVSRQQRRERHLGEALDLAEATSALRERSEKIIEAIPIGVLALDREGRVTATNPYLAERGVRAGGSLAEALPSATPDELALLAGSLTDARESSGAKERLGIGLHLRVGERRDVDVYAIPLSRPLPDVECFLVLHDRTEVRALERNLVRAEKLATIGTLAAGVAHEMGTPLGIISGRAEQLLGRVVEGEAGEPSRKNLSSIMSQVDKVSKTIRQLLDFARVRPIDAELVPPAQATQSAAALLEHRFRNGKVMLEVEAPASVRSVSADPGQLEQVLVNLMMNACDACAEGGRVCVRVTDRGESVVFEVKDDGAGIPPEQLSLVFDPFFTTKKRGQGTGLGLSIAADIVKNHGGILEIESAVAEGTTIRVILPGAAGEQTDHARSELS